jgi:5-methylcytosine-specific restriction endonuclease McrA
MTRLSWKPKEPRLRHRAAGSRQRRRRARICGQYDRIDNDTRLFVWNRDHGRCRNCGSVRDLQFDHVIPKSRGGSSTADNVEVLCGTCNLKKRAGVCTPPVYPQSQRLIKPATDQVSDERKM